ncbi:MAG TPA: hypothetical protein V6C89_08630 [Drouetiella sp.]|jgi:hypothetical protein
MLVDYSRRLLSHGFKSAVVATLVPFFCTQLALASEVPDFMKIVDVNEGAPTAKSKIASDDVYALNEGMFPIYEHSLAIFKNNFRQRHNLIMGLFSAKGGRFILYPAGKDPIEAPSPPIVYRLAKSAGHCAMVTFDLVAPYCNRASEDLSWRGEMEAYRTRVKTAIAALNSIDETELKSEDRELIRDTLQQVQAFMDKSLANNNFTYDDVQAYTRGIKPNLAKLITVASSAQVGHWYKVLEGWKAMLGKDWDNTYALSNSIYVARQNNILFSVLVQFMGTETINDRLLLLETTDFTASSDDMLNAFIRIISDRALGEAFYKNYRLMDYELLGGGGRKAIEVEANKRGKKAILPPLVPYNSNAWPWKTDPSTGSGPALLEDIP